jgi:predicted anti-sigma-YlaC factor YlaD
MVMCADVRVAMSARLDREEPGLAPDVIDAHLAGCAACAAWQAGAARLLQTTGGTALVAPDRGPALGPDQQGGDRRGPALGPDQQGGDYLTESIMAAVAADPIIAANAARRWADTQVRLRRQVLRIIVAAAAVAQLALALPTLIGVLLGSEVGPHSGRETASFDIAFAVGFLAVAYRPSWARAFLPVAVVLTVCLAMTSGVDVIRGIVGLRHELWHVVTLVQAGLLWALSRGGPDAPVGVPWRVASTPR